jgi:hypothetical protein
MSKIEVDAIDKQSGSTLTLGGSGTAVTLASGATQSGFGREGSVDWQTSIKTSDFTAVSGEGYFVNTTSGEITVTLPASPSAGAIVSIKDYLNTADTNAITIARNGSNIDGSTSNVEMTTEGLAVTLVYADATQGWVVVESGKKSDLVIPPKFVTATGGTITTSGNFKIHTFTGPGTFTVSCAGNPGGSTSVDYLVVAGGGAGGGSGGSSRSGAGGGAGGYRESGGTASGCYTVSPLGSSPSPVPALVVPATAYPITVGGGGDSGGPETKGANGANSIFSTITSTGGGAGGARGGVECGSSGGSGGGGVANSGAGTGNTPSVTPPQGQSGSNPAATAGNCASGGGGGAIGAGGAGASAPSHIGGAGGAGATSSINATPTARAGGGGAGGGGDGPSPDTPYAGGAGGAGGGGAGGQTGCNGVAGTTNTGGGGGASGGNPGGSGGSGGSGIVIIRYKFQ